MYSMFVFSPSLTLSLYYIYIYMNMFFFNEHVQCVILYQYVRACVCVV